MLMLLLAPTILTSLIVVHTVYAKFCLQFGGLVKSVRQTLLSQDDLVQEAILK